MIRLHHIEHVARTVRHDVHAARMPHTVVDKPGALRRPDRLTQHLRSDIALGVVDRGADGLKAPDVEIGAGKPQA